MTDGFDPTETFLDIIKEDREFGIFLLAGRDLIFFPA
jgi:hypothetical protein